MTKRSWRAFWRKDERLAIRPRGLVLYGMVWKPLLMNAIALMLLSYVPFILVVVLLSAPAFCWRHLPAARRLSIVIVVVLALLVKVALGDSFAMIAMVAAYHRSTRPRT